ncbi:response regulator [Leifsonia sp. NPDC058248]|uniref:response regulator n=1 Tax=Leifsonia sp. NPDC058248 TaxID=3346402 RepID=UPI0036DB0615
MREPISSRDDEGRRPPRSSLRVVVADDDTFIASLVAEGLRSQGFEVSTASTIADAWSLVARSDPHAVVSDLNFGAGASGAALLQRVHETFPWIGLVVLTSHLTPELAVDDPGDLPQGTVYVVKSELQRVDMLASAIRDAIAGTATRSRPERDVSDVVELTRAQAEVLRMLAAGASTKAIAESRGTSVRAAETMIARLYVALQVDTDPASNPRIAAAQLWQRGRIVVRG